jgi:hypothetical protein
MPKGYIDKLVKKGKNRKDLESKWEKAKKSAESQDHKDNFQYIMGIFKKMIGESTMEIKRNGKILATVEPSENKKLWAVTKESKDDNLEKFNLIMEEKVLPIIEESEAKRKSSPLEIEDIINLISNARYIRQASETYRNLNDNDWRCNDVFRILAPVAKIEGNSITFSDEKQSYRMDLNTDMSFSVWGGSNLKGITSEGKELYEFHIDADKEENNKIYSYYISFVIAK